MEQKDYIKNIKDSFEFNYVLTTHCNLNCKGCRTCASISKPYEVSMKQVLEDIKNLKRIGFNNNNLSLTLFGGEPLLHKGIETILEIMPFRLGLLTNGKVLEKDRPSLFNALKKRNLNPGVSYYLNSDIDYDKVHNNLSKYNLKSLNFDTEFNCIKDYTYKQKFIMSMYDPKGRYNLQEQLNNCKSFFPCIFEGKLFPCMVHNVPNALNYKFGTDFKFEENKDYLVLSKIKDIEEIKTFLNSEFPFCKFCGSDGCEGSQNCNHLEDWSKTKREITEWIRI